MARALFRAALSGLAASVASNARAEWIVGPTWANGMSNNSRHPSGGRGVRAVVGEADSAGANRHGGTRCKLYGEGDVTPSQFVTRIIRLNETKPVRRGYSLMEFAVPAGTLRRVR
jgi:hypothetical protein